MGKIPEDFKPILEQLIRSHSKLSSEEYKRNRGYNNEHYSHKAEDAMINYLLENDREFLDKCCTPST